MKTTFALAAAESQPVQAYSVLLEAYRAIGRGREPRDGKVRAGSVCCRGGVEWRKAHTKAQPCEWRLASDKYSEDHFACDTAWHWRYDLPCSEPGIWNGGHRNITGPNWRGCRDGGARGSAGGIHCDSHGPHDRPRRGGTDQRNVASRDEYIELFWDEELDRQHRAMVAPLLLSCLERVRKPFAHMNRKRLKSIDSARRFPDLENRRMLDASHRHLVLDELEEVFLCCLVGVGHDYRDVHDGWLSGGCYA